jgi:FMN hydrolase / 5-amino-6-(5-phospho-D-ribitylamino)uracil phosphatase
VLEAVIFDWGGTLAPWVAMDHLAGWRGYADVLHPGDPDAAARVAAALLAADEARWRTVNAEHRAFRLDQVIADAGAALRAGGGPDLADHPEALAAYHRHWTAASYTRPEVAGVLTALRGRGLSLGVLSSTSWPGDWHEEFLRRDGVLHHFDACVWSSDLEWTKPHPEAFGAAMAAVGVTDPARCVYVGDRPYDDIHGAASAGMRTVLVPHSDIPAHQTVPVDVRPDAVAHRFTDLPELIAGW